ncbi:MAG TPA: glutamyl-tRNA reductase, partial [Myxococcota bacterium]|nr:glutamyl-tRNA reductase [Myxococcota bacterium]
ASCRRARSRAASRAASPWARSARSGASLVATCSASATRATCRSTMVSASAAAARHLREGRVRRLLVANRTLAHAQELASRHGGVALPLAELDRHLVDADVVLSATASREPVIGHGLVAAALARRRHRPMLLLDLAVPRDIDPAVADLDDAFLHTIDDLERSIEDNRRSRRAAAAEAEAIVDLQVARFAEALQVATNDAPLRALRAHGEAAREAALERARRQLAAGHDPAAVVEQLAHGLTNKLLHGPTSALREAAAGGDAELARTVERLFPPRDPS